MFIYILHFRRKLAGHANHYIGFTRKDDVRARVAEHMEGKGARITRAARAAGIRMRCVRIIEGSRTDERALKRRKNAWKLCPVCRRQRGMRPYPRTAGPRRTPEPEPAATCGNDLPY